MSRLETGRQAPRRRHPKMVPFLATGTLIGLVIGMLGGYLGPDAPQVRGSQELILTGILGAMIGALVGAVIFLVLERMSRR